MPQSESHESLVEKLLAVTQQVPAALDSGNFEGLQELAAETRRISTALAQREPAADDPNALDRLVNARDRILETMTTLRAGLDALARERQVLDTRQRLNKAYGAHRSS